jgi:hypothetical protein
MVSCAENRSAFPDRVESRYDPLAEADTMNTRDVVKVAAYSVVLVACSGASDQQAGTGGRTNGTGGATVTTGGVSGNGGNTTPATGGTGEGLIATKHPGDVGIGSDPAVVWTEDFEEGSTAALLARYDDKKPDGLALDADVPPKSSGAASGKLTASAAGPNAVDFYKNFSSGYEELFVRYYAKYQANAPWHHTGVWIGGYNPPSRWPSPQAGLKPDGDDRFHVSFEPMEQGPAPRMDFYNYWMKMHSWMDQPSGDTAYYGNSLVHEPTLTAKDTWQCFEIHVKLNPSPASGAGAELGLWVDDQSIIQFTDASPLGYWIKDKFCPEAATGGECTDYRPASPALAPLDLQYRNTADLKLTAFWPQNYITDGGAGAVWYDDMVIAQARVGCIR